MKTHIRIFRKMTYGAVALFSLIVMSLPNFAGQAFASNQVTTRSIEMSNSAASATGVTYLVSFTLPDAVQSLVIDFCMDSPIINSSCSTTNDVSVSSATFTSVSGMGSWSLGSASGSTVKLTDGGSATSGAVSFSLSGVANPTAAGSFYARVYTYSDTTYGGTTTAYSSPSSIGNDTDYGGFALSTANTIGISATVMETLTFCVSGTVMTAGCVSMTTPSLTIGHGSPKVIDSTATDTNAAYTQVSTNAQSGVGIRMLNSNGCGGLSRDGGATCDIVAANGGAATAPSGSIIPGSAAFGVYATSDPGLTPANPYATNGDYGMDTTPGSGVTSTYGSLLMSSTSILSNVNSVLTFGASAATTTPAGVYTATMTMICTGTF